MTFTVIGYFEDTMTTYANWYEADNALEAMIQCASEHDGMPLVIVGAVNGSHEIDAPCDGGAVASACDMATLEVTE